MSQPTPAEPADDPTPATNIDDPSPQARPGPSSESPDRDTPAWEGAEPGESVGLVDPRHEIPTPPGM